MVVDRERPCGSCASAAPIERGEADGILIDFWRLWSQKSGIPLRFVGGYNKETQELLRNGEADVLAGLFANERRGAFLDFSQGVLSAPYQLYFDPAVESVKDASELAGRRVGVTRGSFHDDYLNTHFPEVERVLFDGYQALFDAAAAGKVGLFVSQSLYLQRYLDKQGVMQRGKSSVRPGSAVIIETHAALGSSPLPA